MSGIEKKWEHLLRGYHLLRDHQSVTSDVCCSHCAGEMCSMQMVVRASQQRWRSKRKDVLAVNLEMDQKQDEFIR